MGRCNTVKISLLPKLIYRFNAIPIEIPHYYFVDIDKIILKFLWKGKRTRIGKTIMKKNKRNRISPFKNVLYSYNGTGRGTDT